MTETTRLALPSDIDFVVWLHIRDMEKPEQKHIIGLMPLRYKNEELQQTIMKKLEYDRNHARRLEQKERWLGYSKKYYFEEKHRFNIEEQIKIEDHTAELIARKIARHFKFTLNKIRFYGNGGGRASYWHDSVTLPHNPSVVMIAHELAHLHNSEKYGNGKHNKRLATTVKRFIEYGHKMKYWR